VSRQSTGLATVLGSSVLFAGCAGTPDADDGAALPSPNRYVCRHAESAGPVVIDGRLDEAAWSAAEWSSYFVDIEGDVRPTPRFRTRMKMTWDDEALYVAAHMEEPHVWGSLTEHDEIVYHDNDFEIFIDPDGDTENYAEVEINALNTIFDLILVRTYNDGGPAVHGWHVAGMVTAVHIEGTLNDPSDTDEFWSVEFKIPFAALEELTEMPCPPNAGDEWRINFSRVEWRHVIDDGAYSIPPGTKEDNWVWSPQGVINMHEPETWGYVVFER
jgi:hypothetical protein